MTHGVLYEVQVRALGDEIEYEKQSPWGGVVQLRPGTRPTSTFTPTATPAPSSTPSATATLTPTPTGPLALAAPANLRHKSLRSVAWKAVTGASGYRLRWSLPGGSWNFEPVGDGLTEHTISSFAIGAAYDVQVRALGDGTQYEQRGPWSAKLRITAGPTPTPTDTPIPTNTPTATDTPVPTDTPTATDTPTPQPLERPANLRHVSGSTVAWDAVTGAIGYRLRWGLPGGSKEFRTVGSSPLRYEITGLTLNTLYEVQVRALGDEKEYQQQGPWSGVLQFQAGATATPSNTPTETNTPTDTATPTQTNTPTNTPTNTLTPTATESPTPSYTPTPKSLAAPANLRYLYGSTVAWDAVTGAIKYRLRWGAPGGNRQFATVGGIADAIHAKRLNGRRAVRGAGAGARR